MCNFKNILLQGVSLHVNDIYPVFLKIFSDKEHVRIQKVLSEGIQLNSDNNLFLLDGGERIQIPLKVGHIWPASEMP